jgi:topoisomerase-4 subunit B
MRGQVIHFSSQRSRLNLSLSSGKAGPPVRRDPLYISRNPGPTRRRVVGRSLREIPALISHGHLYLAIPPLYRISQGGKIFYARDDKHKEDILKKEFKSNAKPDISRFKGLGEMMAAQLKETTMRRGNRTLLRVVVPTDAAADTGDLVERLMGKKPELRFQYITENAEFARDLDI